MSIPEEDRRCPRCGAPHEEGQEYCLECGSRLPERPGLVAVLGARWRRRLGWYPGDWIWPALLALLIAGVAGTASALWLTDRSNASAETLVAISPAASSVELTETAPEPTTAPTTATETRPAPPPPPAPNQLLTWPAGRSGWTLVLDSLPRHSSVAFAEARQALRRGLKQVGVLDSSRYSSLHPGYFVVFAGIYDSQTEAQSALLDAHEHGYRAAYPREIVP